MLDTLKDLEEDLCLSTGNVLKLARHFKWNKTKIEDNYLLIDEVEKQKLMIKLGMEFDQSLADQTADSMVENCENTC
jgi:hypothetical protein